MQKDPWVALSHPGQPTVCRRQGEQSGPTGPLDRGAGTTAAVSKPLVADRATSSQSCPLLPGSGWCLVPLGPCRPVEGGLTRSCFPDSVGPWGQYWASALRCSHRKQKFGCPQSPCVTAHQKPAISPHCKAKWLNLAWQACGARLLLCLSPSFMALFVSLLNDGQGSNCLWQFLK